MVVGACVRARARVCGWGWVGMWVSGGWVVGCVCVRACVCE